MKKEKYGKCLNWMKYTLCMKSQMFMVWWGRGIWLTVHSAHIWNPMYPIMFVCSAFRMWYIFLYDLFFFLILSPAPNEVFCITFTQCYFFSFYFFVWFSLKKGPNVPYYAPLVQKFPFRCRRVFAQLNAWKLECSIEFHFLCSVRTHNALVT